jgi:hypothetical protein
VVQTAAINTTTPGVLSITTGDQFNWTTSVAGTELAGVVLEVYLMPGQRNNQVNHYFANNGAIDSVFYLATRPMVITRIDYTHASAASGTCTFQVEIESGTTAPGAGSTAVLTTPFDCQGTALVIQNGVLSANTRLNPGDRLSMDFTGTTTGLAGGQLTVTFAPYDDRKDIVFNAPLNANNQDAPFFIADRSYEIVAASAIWSTAATAGANAQLTVCSGTQDAASGLDIIANDTNAGFQIDGTANTVEVGTFIAGRNFLFAGDRLGIDYTVTTSILGLNITVTLRPA